MKTFCVVLLLLSASLVNAEDILLSLLTTNSELVVLRINFSGNRYRIVDRAVFALTAGGGLTAIAPIPASTENGNFQVAWNQTDSTNKIKLFTMILTSDLDAVGTAKKNKPTLTSSFNLNILPSGDQFSIDFKNNVFVRNRSSNGSLGGGAKKAFNVPPGFDPFNTSFAELTTPAAASPAANEIVSCALIYNASTRQYGLVLNKDSAGGEVAFGFTGSVMDAFCEGDSALEERTRTGLAPEQSLEGFDFFFMEYFGATSTGNAGAASTISLKRRKFDGATLAPQGSIVTLVPKKPADRLGTIPFFNMFTVATEVNAAARASAGAHVFYLEQANSCNSTVLKGFHLNKQTGKRNSPFSTLIPCSDALLGDTFLYGLAAFAQ